MLCDACFDSSGETLLRTTTVGWRVSLIRPKMPALPRGTTGFFSRACARVDRDARRATAVDNHHGVTGRWHLAGSGRSLVDWYHVVRSIQESP